MIKKDKDFLNYLYSEYGFGFPKNLNQWKQEPIQLKKGKFVEPTISYIYNITDTNGNTAKISVTKEGRWWKYDKIEGNINFKPVQWSVEPEYKYNDITPSKENVLNTFSKALETNIVDFKKLNENLKETVTDTEVICDNCGWEWPIADGGDDLYICHKCGHDNTPKADDPFGLNELARQFLKEALIETWNPEESFVSLSRYMIDNGMNIKPLPKIKVIKDDKQNASNLLGKTAYYNPVEKSITLYTMDRHPKDVLRSFAHEMIHHEQNLDGRLNNINTTNTNESGDLPEIEREAYEKGNMMLRNWEDKIKNV